MFTFATSNRRKITEASDTFGPRRIIFDVQALTIDEIQHSDPVEIVKAKAKAAYLEVNQPVLVSDTSWSIPALGGFPGGYMKDVASWWVTEDWLAIMGRHRDKRIICHEHLAFYDGKILEHFKHDYQGYFLNQKPKLVTEGNSFENLVVLYGHKTMAQQLSEGEVASAGEQLLHLQKFADWYEDYHA